jgi:hypothetical protein
VDLDVLAHQLIQGIFVSDHQIRVLEELQEESRGEEVVVCLNVAKILRDHGNALVDDVPKMEIECIFDDDEGRVALDVGLQEGVAERTQVLH